ncbi:cytochrome c biogenesis CcdA family protein [Yinghuangia sp. YIM S09857]|uniref:cytochrome c biogenesis CcdA family protein n=1 Tax=Yinghuangia sp. YIM S09857 TaxID=3436929 RepID=UPI003F52E1C1
MFGDVPYALALAAGLVAAFNPCGFALLPAYLTLLVADPAAERGEAGRTAAVVRALRMTGAMTAGFVAVFGVFGLVVTPLALSVQEWLPWATIVIGAVLVALGVWLVAGREVFLSAPKLNTGPPTRSVWSMVLYGVSYAVASLSCTIGPFLALTTSTFETASIPAGVAVFVAYALGMGLVVGVLALAVALAQTAMVTRMRRALRYVGRVSGALLIVAGAYVAYYGWYELRVNDGGSTDDPIMNRAYEIQGALSARVEEIGVGPVAVVFALLAAAGLATAVVHRLRRRRTAAGRGERAQALPDVGAGPG